MVTVVFVVLGFLTDLVAFGVTATTTVQLPFFTPFTLVPVTLQYFFEALFIVTTTFAVDIQAMSRDFKMVRAVIVLLTFTVGGALAATVVVVGNVVVAVPLEVSPDDEPTAAALVTVMV